jgi:predicted nuclease of restriction endonuclease-like (RecB) superfamily
LNLAGSACQINRLGAQAMNKSMINTHLLNQIRDVLTKNRHQLQQTVNHAMVQTYWQIGQLIVEEEQQGQERADYGTKQLKQISQQLTQEFGKGFSTRNLHNMRSFYLVFSIKCEVSAKLSWSHYCVLIQIENPTARQWYMNEAIEQNWSVRALQRQIGVLYYERLLSSKEKTQVEQVEQEAKEKTEPLKLDPKDFLRDPYLLDFLNLPVQPVLESDVEKALIDNLQTFLLELGKGFAFVARQQRISTDDQDFYTDLVFYNFKLKCFILLDLKVGKLNHQDVGQMDTYVRIYDEQHKGPDDNPTIGLILCSQKSEAIAKYSVLKDSEQLFAAKYMSYLPSEDELVKCLEREREFLAEQEENTQ